MKKAFVLIFVCLLMMTVSIGTLNSVEPVSASQIQPTTMANIFTEDFEGVFPGTAWTVGDWDVASGLDYWDDTSYRSYGGSWSCWCAQVGTHDPNKYDNDMNAYMYRSVDLSGYSSVTLSFYYWLKTEHLWDYMWIMYYSAGSWHYIQDHTGDSGGWQFASETIPTSATSVGFYFDADSTGQPFYEGAYVDDVSLTGTPIEYYVTINTSPPGRTFTSDGTPYSTEMTFTWTAGSEHTLGTTSPQVSGTTRYVWSSWSDGGAMSHPVTATGPMTYTANFNTEYQLTVTKNPAQTNGNIKLGSTWYNGVSTASAWFNSGSSPAIEVTTPDTSGGTRYVFSSWSGDKTGSVNPTTITMNSAKSVTANYNTQYKLTVNSAHGTTTGAGWYNDSSIAHSGLTSGVVSGGTGIQYVFTQWFGDATGQSYSQSNPIQMNSPKTATANWVKQYQLTVNSTPITGVNVYVDGATTLSGTTSFQAWFNESTTHTVKAEPSVTQGLDTYQFSNWTLPSGTSTNNPVSVPMDSTKTINANYKLQSNVGWIAGNVYESGGTTPIVGANVIIVGGSGSDITDASGHYNISIDPGAYSVTANKTGYNNDTKSITVTTGHTTSQNFILTVPPPPPNEGWLEGYVYETGTTTAIASVTITVNGNTTTTTSSGHYNVSLAAGSYAAVASKSGYNSDSKSVTIAKGQATTQNFYLSEIPNPGWAIGHVYLSGTSTPISGATVTATGGASDTTGSDGSYNITLSAGSYTITVTKTGYSSDSESITIAKGKETTTNFYLTKDVTNGTIEGYVYETGTTTPINGATVKIQGGNSATTDATGYYSLTLSPGTCTLTASKNDYTSDTKSVTVVAGQVTARDFYLTPPTPPRDETNDFLQNPWLWLAIVVVVSAIIGTVLYLRRKRPGKENEDKQASK